MQRWGTRPTTCTPVRPSRTGRSGPSPTKTRLPRPRRSKASASLTTFFRSESVPTARNATPSEDVDLAGLAGRGSGSKINPGVDDDRLSACLRNPQLELASKVVRDRDYGTRAPNHSARERRDTRQEPDVADVAPVGGHDEWCIEARRDQTRRDEKVRPNHVGSCGRARLAPQLEIAPLPSASVVEHRQVELVAPRSHRVAQ